MEKKILIFGSEGQLGFDLTRVFSVDYNVIALNREDVDVTKLEEVSNVINQQKPDVVINATAYNKVEQAETEKEIAFAINASAVENMAKTAALTGSIFVHLSSDYVFDGTKDFYIEEDKTNPLNVYGQSKLAGEQAVLAATVKYYLIRTSSVFGVKSSKQKKNFVDTIIERAKAAQELRVVSDQVMSPTFAYDLAGKIKELIEKPAAFGIYHITNQGSCSWYEFAKKSLELKNLNNQITPITTPESGTKVNRPKKSILKNLKLEQKGFAPMSDWQNALERYLKEKYN